MVNVFLDEHIKYTIVLRRIGTDTVAVLRNIERDSCIWSSTMNNMLTVQ